MLTVFAIPLTASDLSQMDKNEVKDTSVGKVVSGDSRFMVAHFCPIFYIVHATTSLTYRDTDPRIPVKLTEAQFTEFVLKHIPSRRSGPRYKIPDFKIFNYIL
jgi:hypothetical protein